MALWAFNIACHAEPELMSKYLALDTEIKSCHVWPEFCISDIILYKLLICTFLELRCHAEPELMSKYLALDTEIKSCHVWPEFCISDIILYKLLICTFLELRISITVIHVWLQCFVLSYCMLFFMYISPGHHGPLARYVKFRVAHAPGISGTFSLPPTS